DVLVLQRGHEVGLALEALREAAVDRDRGLQRLDRDLAAERLLHRPVYDRHATAADLGEDPAVTDTVHHRCAGSYGSRARKCQRFQGISPLQVRGWAPSGAVSRASNIGAERSAPAD